MNLPPDLLTLDVVVATNAAPFTPSTHTLVAAPGVGLRLRVWRVDVGMEVGPAAGGAARLVYQGPVSAGVIGRRRIATASNDPPPVAWPGGKVLGTNEPLQALSYADMASLPLRGTIMYTVEDVG